MDVIWLKHRVEKLVHSFISSMLQCYLCLLPKLHLNPSVDPKCCCQSSCAKREQISPVQASLNCFPFKILLITYEAHNNKYISYWLICFSCFNVALTQVLLLLFLYHINAICFNLYILFYYFIDCLLRCCFFLFLLYEGLSLKCYLKLS